MIEIHIRHHFQHKITAGCAKNHIDILVLDEFIQLSRPFLATGGTFIVDPYRSRLFYAIAL